MTNNKTWITIPTYWGDFGDKGNPPTIDFDHPTNPYGDETLSRTLKSIIKLNGDYNVLIVLAVTHKEYLSVAKKRVLGIIKSLNSLKNIYLVCDEDINEINKQLPSNILKMNSYGNIRNVQLFVPYCLGAEFVIAIDDDEIVEDKEYINKIVKELESTKDACGLAGPYYDINGEFEIEGADKLKKEKNIYKSKVYYINEAVKKEMAHEKTSHPSVVAFGGNMAFKRETIKNIPHDPFIPRGEDYDYVINALLYNYRFYFKKDIAIIHMPPKSSASSDNRNFRKLRADIVRFIYMNRKIEEFNEINKNNRLDVEILNPYPGSLIAKEEVLVNQAKDLLLEFYKENNAEIKVDQFLLEKVVQCKKESTKYFKYKKVWTDILSDNILIQHIQNILLNAL